LELLSSDATTKQIPFIFVSAKTERHEIRKGMNLGADDYLTKPFEEDELLGAIRTRLDKAKQFGNLLLGLPALQKKENDIRSLNELKNFFDDHGQLFSY